MNISPENRLEYLRGELRAERISYGELHELQTLAPHIAADDIELREAAGIPEFEPDDDDAREWEALAREQAETWRYGVPVATGCGEVGKPHPDSYRPDLPLRGLGLGNSKPTHKWTLTAKERKRETPKAYAAPVKSKVKAKAPHPDSYRPDLPLRSALKKTSKRETVYPYKHITRYPWALTPDEKKTLDARPLTYTNGAEA